MIAAALLAAAASIAHPPPRPDAPPSTAAESATGTSTPGPPAEGGPRRWRVATDGTLELRATPSSDAPTVATAHDGTVLANLGCEPADDRTWCAVETLRGRTRGHVPAEHLHPATGPDGTVPTGVDDSRQRAREGDFDARGEIRCAQERGQSMSECDASVARSGGGDAAVVAAFPNGFRRTLRFVNGEFVSADATMSGSGSDTDWRREGDDHVLRVDDQRYVIPDVFVVGP